MAEDLKVGQPQDHRFLNILVHVKVADDIKSNNLKTTVCRHFSSRIVPDNKIIFEILKIFFNS